MLGIVSKWPFYNNNTCSLPFFPHDRILEGASCLRWMLVEVSRELAQAILLKLVQDVDRVRTIRVSGLMSIEQQEYCIRRTITVPLKSSSPGPVKAPRRREASVRADDSYIFMRWFWLENLRSWEASSLQQPHLGHALYRRHGSATTEVITRSGYRLPRRRHMVVAEGNKPAKRLQDVMKVGQWEKCKAKHPL